MLNFGACSVSMRVKSGSERLISTLSVFSKFFVIIFLLNYYIAVFTLILIFVRVVQANEPRSPFYIIKGLNYSSNKAYKDKYKTQTGHKPLIGAEIGVFEGKNAERILNFLNIKQLVL